MSHPTLDEASRHSLAPTIPRVPRIPFLAPGPVQVRAKGFAVPLHSVSHLYRLTVSNSDGRTTFLIFFPERNVSIPERQGGVSEAREGLCVTRAAWGRLVRREHIPARPAADLSVVRIYPRGLRPIGPS
eukprot:286052-Prorocentrum_minimum.AAC.1